MPRYTHRRLIGYECSTVGDKRFSAFNALLNDGRSIEEHYQCDIKGYDPGGKNWRLGKGKPPLDPDRDLWSAYLILWTVWAMKNLPLIEELKVQADKHEGVLTDRFLTTPINQAHALAEILNLLYSDET